MGNMATRRILVIAFLAGTAALWGCESQAQKQKVSELSGQVKRLEETNAGLQRQMEALTAENRELRDKLAAAEAKAAPAKKK